jgi:DNA polymerase I-like protein with 3'-5' exonuclease and polymerase domains
LALFEADFPVLSRIRKWRELHKLATGYGEERLKRVSPDRRIHASWRLIGATTGRMSCSGPNLQQVPHVLRPYFRAPAGRALVIADYSQIELRVAAELAGCQPMIEAFKAGEDLHRKTAGMILGKPGDQVSKAERQIAKAANFGLIYGMTSQGLRARVKTLYGMDLSEDDANRFREGFFRMYPQMRTWQNRQKRAREIRTTGGRVWRNLPEPPSYGWRNRLNYPVQGGAAEGLKESLALIMQDLPAEWLLVAVVHDEVVLEVPEHDGDAVRDFLRQRMIDGMARLVRGVPVEVDVSISQAWLKE